MKKKIFIFLIGIILIAVFGAIKEARAGAGDNVWGWAWTGDEDEKTIGWISFNCTDREVDTGKTCVANVTNPATQLWDYGVNINPSTGNFSGYAYFDMNDPSTGEDEIGWIDFAPAGPYPFCPVTTCPAGSPNYSARADLACPGNQCWVTGWARALNYNGGWDGWILLGPINKGGTDYGVYIDNTLSPNQFKGWAWGDSVVGWISFNCSNRGVCSGATGEGGPSDYKVMAELNRPPDQPTTQPETWGYCGGDTTVNTRTTLTLNWSAFSDSDSGDTQQAYEVEIWTTPFFNNVVSGVGSSYVVDALGGDDNGDWSSFFSWGATYNWTVKVQDNKGSWSVWSALDSFTMPSAQAPNPDFSPSSDNPRIEEVVIFTDTSQCYTGFDYCENDGNTGYAWDFEYDGSFDPTDWTEGDATHDYSTIGPRTVRLQVTDPIDGDDRMCFKQKPLTVRFPLPRWREIVPF